MVKRVEPTFKIGDTVLVGSLNTVGTVSAVLSGQSYRVSVGSMQITVRARELNASPLPARHGAAPSEKHKSGAFPTSRKEKVSSTIDLHGLTVDGACRALEAWLNALIMSGTRQGKVIHGLGSGKVQRATHQTLARYAAVRAFKINPVNPGETDVYLDW